MRATPSIVNSPYLSDRSDTPPALSWTPSTPSPAGFSTVPLMLVLRDLPGGSRVGSAGSSHEEIIITASRPAAENDEIKCFMTLYYIAVLGDFLKRRCIVRIRVIEGISARNGFRVKLEKWGGLIGIR